MVRQSTKTKLKTSKKINRREYETEVFNDVMTNQPNKFLELTYKINTKFKSVKQKELYDHIMNIDNRVVFVRGSAGTGKSFITLMAALTCLKEKKYNISKILLSILSVSAGPEIGHIPGLIDDKMAPYYSAFWSNISKLIGSGWSRSLKDTKQVEEILVNFVRGQTFNTEINGIVSGYIVIIDEVQNFSTSELKLMISRLGENTKIICLGDPDQIDRKFSKHEKNGLDDAFERFQGIDGVTFIEFNEEDIVRDKFLIEIMKRYKE